MRRWTIALALITPLALPPAGAQTLDAESAKKLFAGKTWVLTEEKR